MRHMRGAHPVGCSGTAQWQQQLPAFAVCMCHVMADQQQQQRPTALRRATDCRMAMIDVDTNAAFFQFLPNFGSIAKNTIATVG